MKHSERIAILLQSPDDLRRLSFKSGIKVLHDIADRVSDVRRRNQRSVAKGNLPLESVRWTPKMVALVEKALFSLDHFRLWCEVTDVADPEHKENFLKMGA